MAAAAQVTEPYISQLMTGKKAPPAPDRTDIYRRMETFLKLPAGKLAALAALERLITQKLLDVVKRVTKEELDDEKWLRSVARLTDRSFEEMRVIVIEFLISDRARRRHPRAAVTPVLTQPMTR